MPKFEIHTEAVIRRRYEVEAKDADFARIKVQSGTLAPHGSVTSEPNVTQVAQIGPRYYAEETGVMEYKVFDRKTGLYIAIFFTPTLAYEYAYSKNKEEEEQ